AEQLLLAVESPAGDSDVPSAEGVGPPGAADQGHGVVFAAAEADDALGFAADAPGESAPVLVADPMGAGGSVGRRLGAGQGAGQRRRLRVDQHTVARGHHRPPTSWRIGHSLTVPSSWPVARVERSADSAAVRTSPCHSRWASSAADSSQNRTPPWMPAESS